MTLPTESPVDFSSHKVLVKCSSTSQAPLPPTSTSSCAQSGDAPEDDAEGDVEMDVEDGDAGGDADSEGEIDVGGPLLSDLASTKNDGLFAINQYLQQQHHHHHFPHRLLR